jgi:DNA-binding NarL/FixJ family response regulator
MTPRILVVEDDEVIAKNLGALLTEFGYEFLGAVSEPAAAFERARLLNPDLILMDIFFEGVPRGLDLAQQLSEETGARIVFVGGASDPSTFMRLIHAAPFGFVDKPIDPQYLHAVLDRAFRGSATLTAVASSD